MNTHKVITAILPKGRGMPLIASLREEKQVVAANLNYARGVGRMAPLRFRGMGEQSEKEVLNVVVDAARAEEIYTFLYHEAGIDNPHAGILFMAALSAANEFTLPTELEDEQ